MENIQKIIKTSVVALLIGLFAISNTAFAASVAISPASDTFKQGTNFSVSVNVASTDQAMNAASGTITFPKDRLQVVSVSKNNSIVDFWAVEPSFSNTAGTISFEGVVLTPGYQGSAGKILTITFKGKSTGLADVKFSSNKILANDGIGTNIGTAAAGASFTISEAAPAEPEVIDLDEFPVAVEEAPEESCETDSLIYSTTHPGTIWRKENTAIFSWDAGDDIVASRIAFDHNPNTDPSNVSKPALVEKKYENVADGVWYFHLSLQDDDGWTPPEHFKIKIDSKAPEISLKEIPRTDLTDPKVVIDLSITDTMSCIKQFTLSIDGEEVDYNKLPNGNLELETIEPGTHELAVIAYDRAGNQNESYIDVEVKAIEAPVVKDYPAKVARSSDISVTGETIKDASLTAKITNKKSSFVAREDFQSGSGRFEWTPGMKLKGGTYLVSFRVTDTRGAMSNWTEPAVIRVGGGVSIDVGSLISKIPPEVAMFGLIAVGIFLVVFITRTLTMRALKRRHKDWE